MIPEFLKTTFEKESNTELMKINSDFLIFEKSESSTLFIGTFPEVVFQNLAELPEAIKQHDKREKERLIQAKLDKKKIRIKFV